MIRYQIILIAITFFVAGCATESSRSNQQIIVSNHSSIDLADKPVKVPRTSFVNLPAGKYYPLLLSVAGDTVAVQLDDLDGDNNWDDLFFVANIPANKSDTLSLSWLDKEIPFSPRTSIRFGVRKTVDSKVLPVMTDTFYANQLPHVIGYQRYQTDGPTWENDKVGFRLYLDGRNSIDIFGKTRPEITPEDVGIGKDGLTDYNYSGLLDWGTDILGVGNSVGIGGVSMLIGDSLVRLGITEQDSVNNVDTTICRIVTKGPSRSILSVDYINWHPSNRNYGATTTTSIWPGMYGFRNSIQFSNLMGDETLVVGLVNSKTDLPLTVMEVNDKWVVLFSHDKQTVNKDWWLGMAIILPKAQYIGYMEAPKTGSLATTYLGKLKIENNKPVDYYVLACWELTDERFRDVVYFKRQLTNVVEQIMADVSIEIN